MLLDDVLTIDRSAPAVRKAFPRARSNGGALSWHSGDLEIASVGFSWNATSRRIELRYAMHGVSHTQRITVVETTPHYGGQRSWFWCETSNRRTRALVLRSGATHWVARAAAGLSYASQGTNNACIRRLLAGSRRERARVERNAVRCLRRRERAAERGA